MPIFRRPQPQLALERAAFSQMHRFQKLNVLFLCILSATIAMAAWSSWGHPSWALLAIVPWALCRTRSQAFGAALAYYSASMTDLTVITARFFELGIFWGTVAGICAWLVWATVLAAAQALPHSPNRLWQPFGVLVGLVLTAIPPVGWFSVVSPLNALGYWFPGTAWWGLLFGALFIFAIAQTVVGLSVTKRDVFTVWPIVGVALLTVVSIAHVLWHARTPLQSPAGWVTVDTHLGAYRDGQMASLERVQELNRVIAQQKSVPGTRVLVLPEMAIGEWRPRTAFWLKESIHATDTDQGSGFSWISGASYVQDADKRDLANGVLLASGNQVQTRAGRIPMPLAMWRPGGYAAHPWSVPVFELDGQRATVSICYEDLLPWAQWQSYWQNPTVHLSLSSLWFAQDLHVGSIQERSATGWARMFGVPLLRAVNN